eukprot:13187663-Heterocapsa_arctica.AAC.1
MVFIKAARTAYQEAVQKRKREQQEEYAGRWTKDQASRNNTAEDYREQPSSSGTRRKDRGWNNNKWKDAADWVDYEQKKPEGYLEPEYDAEGKIIIQG